MCEGSFLPSSFRPHQKHTEFESSLRSYPINPFALFAKRRGLFPSHVGAGALTRPGGDFFRAAEQNLPSHTCHSEERRDESLLSNPCHSESALAVRNLLFAGFPNAFALFAKAWGLFSRSRTESAFTHLSSEERRDESLLSNTCHSESALAVRNLLFAGVPLDKSEGVVKTEISWAVREHRFFAREG